MPFYDITDETLAELGMAVTAPQSGPVVPKSIRWDCSIGGLPFLMAPDAQFPNRRETADFRRERIDNERDPGEQSLDSGYWIRSQSSWHYGAGITTAEPVESNSEETRFRFANSGGIDPWTPGKLSLLPAATAAYMPPFGAPLQILGVDTGVLYAGGSTMRYVTTSGTTAITWGGTTFNGYLASDGSNWYASNASGGIYKGALPSGAGALAWNTATACWWVKSRLMGASGPSLYELVGAGPALPAALYTHPVSNWSWSDMAEGPAAIYVSGGAGDTSMIYKIGVTVSGATITLSAPTVCAEMPRGELIRSLYSYVGTYLLIGTSSGVRVASINSDGSLTVGPLLFTVPSGAWDFVAEGSFVYVAVGSDANVGDGTTRGGLYRIDLGRTLDKNPLKFAYASDMVATSAAGSQYCRSVTYADGKVWFGCFGNVGLGNAVFYRSSNYVTDGWLETGRVRLGTVENKAWRDIRVIMGTSTPGTLTARATVTGVGAVNTWDTTVSVSNIDPDKFGSLNVTAPAPAQALYAAFNLHATDTSQSPTMIGYQIRAIPAPKRTELVQVSLMLMDREKDRKGVYYGAPGGAWKRYQLLKTLEASASTVQWQDYTTGEAAEAYIERVTYIRTSAPNHNDGGNGGRVQVLLRLV